MGAGRPFPGSHATRDPARLTEQPERDPEVFIRFQMIAVHKGGRDTAVHLEIAPTPASERMPTISPDHGADARPGLPGGRDSPAR